MKDNKPNSITIDDIEYVRKDSATAPAMNTEGLPYVIIRSKDSGCHAGYMQDQSDLGVVVLLNARRLWFWSGAASLSQLAMDGVSDPDSCKFPCEVPEIKVLGVCEIIPATSKALESISLVKVWSK